LTFPEAESIAIPAFPHTKPSGRIEVERRDNTVVARTRGVRAFKLLLSPDQFDFDRPLKVIANGTQRFNGFVKTDVATLLQWNARDNDRTMEQ
jgi:hypothetical protein